ncbi:MAG TPA: hypothetical protein VLT47_05710 [Anaeromyxobacteraceae bacterium]|nr:hypothetical protein [Anaeromyxobacteraceae bacterium]
MSCPRIDSCPLFKQFQMKAALRVWQGYYCEGDQTRCERWKLVSANKPVPMNLLPNGRTLDVPLDHLEARHMS